MLVPEPPERRLSHASCAPDAGRGRAPAIPSHAIGPSLQETQFVHNAIETLTPTNAGPVSQVCDYCRRNNKDCRLKLSGTCFTCAERKKKCKFSRNPMSAGRGLVTGPVDAAMTQPDVRQPSVTPSFGGAHHRPRSNLDSPSNHVTRLHESAPLLSHSSVVPPAPNTSTESRDIHISDAASTVDEDVELPPSRTIRSSSLVRRWTGEVHEDESIKRRRIAHST